MNKIKYITLSALMVSIFAGCNGDGGADLNNRFNSGHFAGRYVLDLRKLDDNCNIGFGNKITDTVLVNQDNNRVVLDAEQLVAEGDVNDNDGFDVVGTRPVNECTGTYKYFFKNASDGFADVDLVLSVDCGRGTQCEVNYSGTGGKVGDVSSK